MDRKVGKGEAIERDEDNMLLSERRIRPPFTPAVSLGTISCVPVRAYVI